MEIRRITLDRLWILKSYAAIKVNDIEFNDLYIEKFRFSYETSILSQNSYLIIFAHCFYPTPKILNILRDFINAFYIPFQINLNSFRNKPIGRLKFS